MLEPAIDAAIHKFNEWTQSININVIRDAVNSVGNTMIDIAERVGIFFVDMKARLDCHADILFGHNTAAFFRRAMG